MLYRSDSSVLVSGDFVKKSPLYLKYEELTSELTSYASQ